VTLTEGMVNVFTVLKQKKTEAELLELFRTRQNDRKKFRRSFKRRTKSAPEKASSLLTQFFKNEPDALIRMKESQALLAWPNYVGVEAALVSKPIKIKDAEMVVCVSDPLWLHQLILLKNQILKCYRRDFPQLKLNQLFFKRGEIN